MDALPERFAADGGFRSAGLLPEELVGSSIKICQYTVAIEEYLFHVSGYQAACEMPEPVMGQPEGYGL
jgi:hypothetical protein